MSQLGEAIARYNKILESEPYRDLAWAEALSAQMQARRLSTGGRAICPTLRPHFILRRQYATLVKAAEALFSAIDRIKQIALSTPALLARMELLPAERMLASVDPGYPYLAVTSLLDTYLDNGSLRFIEYNADTPTGAAFSDILSDLFLESPPIKEFAKRYSLSKAGGMKSLVEALVAAYREFGGTAVPRIAILELRQPFQAAESGEYLLLRDYFRQEGYPTEVVSPDQLEYRNGVLRRADFPIDLVYRRVKAQEFLLRFDLTHPLVRAYRERAVCVVNSFRAELAHKKAIFDLLTDESVTAGFPVNEKKAIRDYIPWTRVVANTKSTYQDQPIDLVEFILKNREKLILKPNDSAGDQHSFHGWETDASGWERALKTALRYPYVVQEKVEPIVLPFPVFQYGELEFRDMHVDLHPQAYLGKVQGCSTWLSVAGSSAFSTLTGLAPTFILDSRS